MLKFQLDFNESYVLVLIWYFMGSILKSLVPTIEATWCILATVIRLMYFKFLRKYLPSVHNRNSCKIYTLNKSLISETSTRVCSKTVLNKNSYYVKSSHSSSTVNQPTGFCTLLHFTGSLVSFFLHFQLIYLLLSEITFSLLNITSWKSENQSSSQKTCSNSTRYITVPFDM